MANVTSKRERYFMYNSLMALVQCLQQRYTTVELRGGNTVSGQISAVDGFMNLVMNDVVLITADGRQHMFEDFFVLARNINFISIPQEINISQAISSQLESNRRKFQPLPEEVWGGGRVPTKGKGRAKKTSTSTQPK